MASERVSSSDEHATTPIADAVIDGGDLDCGSGLLLMIRGAMEGVAGGRVLEIRSREISVCEDLPAWCRMVGHTLVSEVPAENKYTRYFVKKRGGDSTAAPSSPASTQVSPPESTDPEFAAHIAKARAYQWRVRAKSTDGMNVRVFARNHQVDAGQPASFNTEDQHPGAIELMLAALASCIVSGLVWRLTKAGWKVTNAEATLSAKLGNVLVFLGIEKDGSPAIETVSGKVFVAAEAPPTDTPEESPELDNDEAIEALFQETMRLSPMAQTLGKAAHLDITCKLVD